MTKGLVSVVLPIYKGEKHIAEAIDSILAQSYPHFELLLINDCSPDGSLDIIKTYSDERIRISSNERNLGLIGALNVGMSEAQGEFIARKDQDDIALITRFEHQVKFLQDHSDAIACGTQY